MYDFNRGMVSKSGSSCDYGNCYFCIVLLALFGDYWVILIGDFYFYRLKIKFIFSSGIAVDVLLVKKKWRLFVKWCLISIAVIMVRIYDSFKLTSCPKILKLITVSNAILFLWFKVPMVSIDSILFGRFTVARLNSVLYNVFSEHGPNVFGTLPFRYYFINGFENFNVLFPLALVALPGVIVTINVKPFGEQHGSLIWTTLLPLYLWIFVFFAQPHKVFFPFTLLRHRQIAITFVFYYYLQEERFLYPIYPLIGLAAAIAWTCFESCLKVCKFEENFSHFLTIGLLLSSSLISVSRIIAIYRGTFFSL